MANSIQSIRRLSVAMVMDQEEMLARMQIQKELGSSFGADSQEPLQHQISGGANGQQGQQQGANVNPLSATGKDSLPSGEFIFHFFALADRGKKIRPNWQKFVSRGRC